MIAEFCLNRSFGKFAFVHAERSFRKFRNHHIFSKIAQFNLIFRIFVSQFYKILAFFQLGNNFFGFGFRIYQNMLSFYFLLAFKFGFIVIIQVLNSLVCNSLIYRFFKIQFASQIFLCRNQLSLILRCLLNIGSSSSLIYQLAVYKYVKRLRIKFFKRNLVLNLRMVSITLLQIVDINDFPVDFCGNTFISAGIGIIHLKRHKRSNGYNDYSNGRDCKTYDSLFHKNLQNKKFIYTHLLIYTYL